MEQGSTPDIPAGGVQPSLPSSADIAGVAPAAQPSQGVPAPSPAQNGDLLGGLMEKSEKGEQHTGTSAPPSQTPPANPTPQADPQNPGQPQAGDSVDEELTKWASSQGLSLNTETEIKLAKRLRDTQKWAHENRANNNQTFDDIQQQLGDDLEDPVEADLRTVKAQLARRDFWDANADDRHLEGQMIAEVQKMVENGDVDGARYYSTPQGWGHLLSIVKSSSTGSPQRDEQFEAGRQAERESLAKVQQAAPPVAAATSSAPPAPVDEDALIAKMSPAEYDEWRKNNNPFAPR